MIRKQPQLGSMSILQNTDRQVKYAMQVLLWQVSKKNNSDYIPESISCYTNRETISCYINLWESERMLLAGIHAH